MDYDDGNMWETDRGTTTCIWKGCMMNKMKYLKIMTMIMIMDVYVILIYDMNI